jgi:hypothetical protein
MDHEVYNEKFGIHKFEVSVLGLSTKSIDVFTQSLDVSTQSTKILVQSIDVLT